MALFVPAMGFGSEIALGQIRLDARGQLPHVRETAGTDRILRQVTKEPFDKVEPRTASGREMRLEPLRHPPAAVWNLGGGGLEVAGGKGL